MRILLIIVYIFLFSSSALSFINIESLRQGLKDGFNGSSGMSLGGASGNVRVFGLGVNSQNIYRNDQREYILIANYDYGEAKKVKNNNKGQFHLRYAQGFSQGLFWEVFAQAEFNEFQSLSLRKLIGGGLRSRLLSNKNHGLFLGVGSFYEDEKIDDDANRANFRGNVYLSLRNLFSETLESVLVLYYQPSFNIVNDYRIQATAGLETKITERLQLVNSFSFASDTRPPQGIQKEDFTYKIVFNFSY